MNTDLKLMPRATNLRSRPESPESYLARLEQEALNHRAMNHPWIDAIENGRFADTRSAIRDFALQYAGYSAWFPNYLTAVISRLERDDHKELLGHNLEEEQGHRHR